MQIETIVLLFNGVAMFLNVFYQFIRLYYERKKIRELEKQTRLMVLERDY